MTCMANQIALMLPSVYTRSTLRLIEWRMQKIYGLLSPLRIYQRLRAIQIKLNWSQSKCWNLCFFFFVISCYVNSIVKKKHSQKDVSKRSYFLYAEQLRFPNQPNYFIFIDRYLDDTCKSVISKVNRRIIWAFLTPGESGIVKSIEYEFGGRACCRETNRAPICAVNSGCCPISLTRQCASPHNGCSTRRMYTLPRSLCNTRMHVVDITELVCSVCVPYFSEASFNTAVYPFNCCCVAGWWLMKYDLFQYIQY